MGLLGLAGSDGAQIQEEMDTYSMVSGALISHPKKLQNFVVQNENHVKAGFLSRHSGQKQCFSCKFLPVFGAMQKVLGYF